MTKKQKKMLYRIIAALALVLVLKLLPPLPASVELLLYCIPYLVVGWDVLRKALLGIKNRQPFDECFLMAVATVGAFALGDYVEGCAVIIFYQIGELFQGVAVGKSRRSISALMDIRPDYANIEGEDGRLEQVDPDEVEIGTLIVVQPDVLGRIEAATVHADGFQCLYVGLELLLHARILGLEVFHANFAVGHLPAVSPVDIASMRVIEVGILPEIGHPFENAVGVVGHHIHNHLDAQLVRFGTKGGEVGLRSERVGTDFGVARPVERVPTGRAVVVGLGRRSLHSGESCSGNVRQIGRDVGVLPVEAVQYHTLLNGLGQPIAVAGKGRLQRH